MNIDVSIAVHDWDKDLSKDELLECLVHLKAQAAQTTPILDDDDVDEAVDDAADRIAAR